MDIVQDRLYFKTDAEGELIEYDLQLLMEFIKEGMDYKPRVITHTEIEDFHVNDSHDIITLTSDGNLSKVKSFLGKRC